MSHAAEEGVICYENWKVATAGDEVQLTHETPLYTDVSLRGPGAHECGPYTLMGTDGEFWASPMVHPRLVLRVDYHLVWEGRDPGLPKDDTERYHGGNLDDEIAALSSLLLGVRLKAGGVSRHFIPTDPKGRPVQWDTARTPYLPAFRRPPRIPSACEPCSLAALSPLKSYFSLSASGANVLMRAARLYQEALWISEADANMSWLLFVASIETAASHWRRSADQIKSPSTLLAEIHPKLSDILAEPSVEHVRDELASYLAPLSRATASFVEFLLSFCPPPPTKRPGEPFRLVFEDDALRGAFRRIYRCRSAALHAGTPFPLPMCERPGQLPESDAPLEVPLGTAMSALGGSWTTRGDTMYLHMFEYIVRNALLAWWDSLAHENAA